MTARRHRSRQASPAPAMRYPALQPLADGWFRSVGRMTVLIAR
jgi:hypothetical protein